MKTMLVQVSLLAGTLLCAQPDVPAAHQAEPRLIGLVELPGLFGAPDPDGPPGSTLGDDRTPVPLFSEPHAEAPELARISAPDSIEWTEYGYEAPAARAYGVERGWVRVAMRAEGGPRYGWVPPEHAGPVHTLEALLTEGLAYLTPEWDGSVREEPSMASLAMSVGREADEERVDVNVLATTESDAGELWLQVEVLGPGRCERAEAPVVRARGWVPASRDDGQPNAWFYARGC